MIVSSEQIRDAADVLVALNEQYGHDLGKYWCPWQLHLEAEQVESERMKHAECEALVEELAQDAFRYWFSRYRESDLAAASKEHQDFWRERARKLVNAGWSKA